MEFCSWCKLLGCLPGGTGTQQALLTLKVSCSSFGGFNIWTLPTCFSHVNCNKLKLHSLMLNVGFFPLSLEVGGWAANQASSLPWSLLQLSTCSKTVYTVSQWKKLFLPHFSFFQGVFVNVLRVKPWNTLKSGNPWSLWLWTGLPLCFWKLQAPVLLWVNGNWWQHFHYFVQLCCIYNLYVFLLRLQAFG